MRHRLLLFFLALYTGVFAQQATGYKLFFEKVYLHTDRETYTVGEDIWFCAYLTDAQSGKLTISSNNLYVEVISPASTITERKVIRLDKGLGQGDFHLSDQLPAGTYHIRAYTNWMRNFGANFLFDKKIQVFSSAAPAVTAADTAGKKLTDKPASGAALSKTATAANPLLIPTIHFFPEGGSMTDGVAGIIAFRTESGDGKSIAANGRVLSASGEVLAQFVSGANGMGVFRMLQAANQAYIVKGITAAGRLFSATLPSALKQGFSLNVRNADSILQISVGTNAATLSTQQERPIQLLFKNHGKAYRAMTLPLSGPQSSVTVSKDGFPPGISSITLIDAMGRPQCERLFYNNGTEKAFLSLSTDKQLYGPKGKTTVTVKATDQNGRPLRAALSLAAVDAGIIPQNSVSVISYLQLQSELHGEIEQPGQYFDEDNAGRRQQLDLLLLTQGWSDYTWKRLADSALQVSHTAEQGITISGRVIEKARDTPIAGANITLSAPGAKGNKLFMAQTDSAGRYYFDGIGLYGRQRIGLTSKDGKGQPSGVLSVDSLHALPPPVLKPAEETPVVFSGNSTSLLDRQKTVQRQRISDTIALKEVAVKANSKSIDLFGERLTTFGYPDEVYTITPKDYDYRNIYHYLQHRSKAFVGDVYFLTDELSGAVSSVRLSPPAPLATYENYSLLYYSGPGGTLLFPRIFVNGVQKTFSDEKRDLPIMADAQRYFFSMPVDKTEKIVIKHVLGPVKMLPGGATSSNVMGVGIQSMSQVVPVSDVYLVYLTFKPGALDREEKDVISAEVSGYYTARTFYAPRYETVVNKPDMRTTIHWAPSVITNEKGEASLSFYNADPKTKIRIVAEGITEQGLPVSGKAMYEVK